MLNKHESRLSIEKFFIDCWGYWNRTGNTDKESFRRALEWDIVEIFKFNGNVLHDVSRPDGEELDSETVIEFIKEKAMDLYGLHWEKEYKAYEL